MPEPIDTPLDYPDGQSASAVVVLDLGIDKNGAVSDVSLVSGESPFAEAALAAARNWTFLPAERDGRRVAARIRYTVEFEPPVPAAPEEAQPLPEKSQDRARLPPVEVLVRGRRPEMARPGSVKLTREETRVVPGSFGDPLRAIEAQPGVIPIVSGLPSFFVRGAPPANVGYFIDGVDVPLLYHAFFGPSVIHPGLIESVDLYSSVAPVEYGRFAGPIVAAGLRPLAHRFTGEGSVRIIDAGALVEAPFGGCPEGDLPDCSRGSARVGGRYAYTGLVLSALSDAKLSYWDYQANVSYALGRRDAVSVLAFGAYDFFEAGATSDQGGGEVTFHRLDLRWDNQTDHTHTRVALTGGLDSTGGVEEATSKVGSRSVRLRTELDAELSEVVTLRAGMDGRIDDFQLDTDPLLLNFADYSTLFPQRTEVKAGAYVSTELRATRSITVVPGVRADVFHDRGVSKLGVDPRITANYVVARVVTLEHSLGMAHQVPNFVPNVPGAQVADLENGLQQAVMWSSGVRWRLPSDLTASATVYRSAYFDALDPIGSKRDFSIDRTVSRSRSKISTAGLELTLKRPLTRKLGGFISYTFSHTEHAAGAEEAISGFDRPHVLQVALGYDFGKGFSAGARAVFYSGVPELNLEGRPHFTANRRGRPYFRTDLRGEKRFRIGNSAYWGIIAEALNATSTDEVADLRCGEVCIQRVAGPVILPSIGIEGGF